MDSSIETTVIGSYPVVLNQLAMMESYYNGEIPLWNPYITKAVESMCQAGIDLVSDGQTRDPFIHIFCRGMEGCRIRSRVEVIGPISLSSSITKSDLSFVSSILPSDKKLLGLIVGPFTLSESVVDQWYTDKKELAFAFAYALQEEIKQIEPFVDVISIDEPFFANMFPEYGKELLEVMIGNVSCPIRLHVCGNVSSIVDQLVDLPVDILSHEFKATPSLFHVFSQYPSSKDICLGCVRSDHQEVESVDEICDHIKRGQAVFGSHIKQLAPDCGLRMLSPKNAFEKLKNLVIAKEMVYG